MLDLYLIYLCRRCCDNSTSRSAWKHQFGWRVISGGITVPTNRFKINSPVFSTGVFQCLTTVRLCSFRSRSLTPIFKTLHIRHQYRETSKTEGQNSGSANRKETTMAFLLQSETNNELVTSKGIVQIST